MSRTICRLGLVGATAAALAMPVIIASPASAGKGGEPGAGAPDPVRFATYNASLNRGTEGALLADLQERTGLPNDQQPDVIAEIVQRTRPDVLLINEFDYDTDALDVFRADYLGVDHGDAEAIQYPYAYIAPSNTGIPSGFDYNNDGVVGGPDDAHGFGFFPGQFGMAVLSRYPIDLDGVRTFQTFKWKDMPGALLPDDPATPDVPGDWYTPGPELDSFRLSSKSHWDVPIEIGSRTVHFLVSHPTPPVFDDPVIDWNGRRNHDEIRFWADYVSGPKASSYIYDDDGMSGGLHPGAQFVIAGDQNSDPFDGDSIPGSAQQLLDSPQVNTKVTPSSEGAVEQSSLQGDNNLTQIGDPAFDTADFAESIFGGPGNVRVDYVLPSKGLRITDAGVFWPVAADPLFSLVGTFPFPSSDHKLVWIDVATGGFPR